MSLIAFARPVPFALKRGHRAWAEGLLGEEVDTKSSC